MAAGALPRRAQRFLVAVAVAALAASAASLVTLRPDTADLVAFAVLAPLAAGAQLLIVRTGRSHGFHTALAFVIAAALLLPPGLVAILVIAQHVPEWLKERYPWYIQTFNVSNYTLNALAAWAAADAAARFAGDDGLAFAAAGVAAAATFVVFNHLLLGSMLRVARGRSFRESELLSPRSLAIDSVVAGVGVSFAFVWHANPWLLPIVAAPLVLSQHSFALLGALRTSEERFRTMFEDAAHGIALTDLEGSIVTANRAFADMIGRETGALTGVALADLAHPDDADVVAQTLARVAGEIDHHGRLQARYEGTLGRTVWSNVTASLVRDAGRRPRFVLAMVEDVTQRREAEQAVRESEERYRELFQNANDMVFTVDEQAMFTSINAAGERLTGFTEAELVGNSIADLFTPECRDVGMGQLASKVVGQPPATHEWTIRARDGREVALEVACAAIRRDGRVVGVQAIARDLSERKELEQQLRQAQKMEAVGRLAGGVAHDFNNLMTAITGYSELALQRVDAGTRVHRRDLEEIQKAADRARRLTTQLLAFSRKQVLQPTKVDLNDVVRDMEKLLGRLIGADVRFVTKLDASLGAVEADRSQLEQVLMNLAVNARDAMPEGGTLTIETAHVDVDAYSVADPGVVPGGSYVVLTVGDTGTGMDDATQARVFDPFFTTKEVGKGTGLGLATVYGIVKQSGGYITVESAPGEGSAFRLYLRRLRTDANEPAPLAPSAALVGGVETILLVEDDAAVREVVHEILEGRGYRVLVACDGVEALDVARDADERIDLLLTDAVMPRLGGPALADELSAQMPSLKILFMSGYSEDAIESNGTLRPGTHFLQKPFSAAGLAEAVRNVLDERPLAA